MDEKIISPEELRERVLWLLTGLRLMSEVLDLASVLPFLRGRIIRRYRQESRECIGKIARDFRATNRFWECV